jgi:hypothetical protein
MCAYLTNKSGGIALFNGADHLEKRLAPFAHPGPDANLPIAHRLTDFSPWHATLARTICIVLNILGNEFGMLHACKHGCMFVGALHFSRMLSMLWSTTTAWIALTAGLKQLPPFA